MKLSHLTFTSKEGFPCEHLSKDAASSPHVDGFCVVVRREQQSRRSVPLGDQTFRKMALYWKGDKAYLLGFWEKKKKKKYKRH